MKETQKQAIEEKIWSLLMGFENIYKTEQPTFTYSTEDESYCMKKELLEKLPLNLRSELLTIVTICKS